MARLCHRGGAVAQLKLDTAFSDNFGGGASASGFKSESKTGWSLGVGGEYDLNARWAIRGEYLYANYGSMDAQSVVKNPSYPSLSNVLSNSIDFVTHTYSLAVMYRFP